MPEDVKICVHCGGFDWEQGFYSRSYNPLFHSINIEGFETQDWGDSEPADSDEEPDDPQCSHCLSRGELLNLEELLPEQIVELHTIASIPERVARARAMLSEGDVPSNCASKVPTKRICKKCILKCSYASSRGFK